MAATIAVVYPHMNSIGGDGFWLIARPEAAGCARSKHAASRARRATIARYRETGSTRSRRAGPTPRSPCPGAIGGWALALELSASLGGRLPLAVLFGDANPACARGLSGLAFGGAQRADRIRGARRQRRASPRRTSSTASRPKQGAVCAKAPQLADTLAHLADAGLDDFYRGDVGREIAAISTAIGAPVTRADLKRLSRRLARAACSFEIAGATLYNAPPPTQGLASLIDARPLRAPRRRESRELRPCARR